MLPMWAWAAELAILSIVCLAGLLLTALRMPGTWLIAGATLLDHWYHSWPTGQGWVLYTVLAIALLAEVIEFGASGFTARRAGATPQAAWGALLGGFIGIFLLAVPLFLIGSMIGAILGCFLGAALTEMWMRKRVLHGARVGFFAALGMVLGTVAKTAAALVMTALFLGSRLLAE